MWSQFDGLGSGDALLYVLFNLKLEKDRRYLQGRFLPDWANEHMNGNNTKFMMAASDREQRCAGNLRWENTATKKVNQYPIWELLPIRIWTKKFSYGGYSQQKLFQFINIFPFISLHRSKLSMRIDEFDVFMMTKFYEWYRYYAGKNPSGKSIWAIIMERDRVISNVGAWRICWE